MSNTTIKVMSKYDENRINRAWSRGSKFTEGV